MNEVIPENQRLRDQLDRINGEVEDLRKQLANYEKDKETLRVGLNKLWKIIFAKLIVVMKDVVFCVNKNERINLLPSKNLKL